MLGIVLFHVVLGLLSNLYSDFQGLCQVLAMCWLGLYGVLLVAFGVCSCSSSLSSQGNGWLQDDIRVGKLWGRLDVNGVSSG